MTSYLIRRVLYSIFVLWGAATIVFVAIRLVPGDPALLMLGTDATPETLQALRVKFGLDQPAPVQYGRYLQRVITLDLGDSTRQAQPVTAVLGERLPNTAQLALTALLLALVISFPLGITAALRPRSVLDRGISVLSLIGQSLPAFWTGIMFILLFARTLRLLPSAGAGSWQNLVLPAITVALPLLGVLTRLVRGGLLDVLDEEYVRTARAKGLAAAVVLRRHAIRNMLIPVVTVLGLQVGTLFGGAVITETVFGWPGVGRLLIDSISQRDYPVVQATVLLLTGGFVIINLVVDLSYGYLDPRVRLS